MGDPDNRRQGHGGVYTFVAPQPNRWLPGNIAIGYWVAQADAYKLCGGSTAVLLLVEGESPEQAEDRFRNLFPQEPSVVEGLVWMRRALFCGNIQPGETPPEMTRDPRVQGTAYMGQPIAE